MRVQHAPQKMSSCCSNPNDTFLPESGTKPKRHPVRNLLRRPHPYSSAWPVETEPGLLNKGTLTKELVVSYSHDVCHVLQPH